jgi:hypothetical protein
MDGTGDHHVEPSSERQTLHVLSHIWKLDLRMMMMTTICREYERGTVWEEPGGEGKEGKKDNEDWEVNMMYENKPTKTGKKKKLGREITKTNKVNLIKVGYVHLWKYHNETPLYNLCMLI